MNSDILSLLTSVTLGLGGSCFNGIEKIIILYCQACKKLKAIVSAIGNSYE